jgi:hypothetical protein
MGILIEKRCKTIVQELLNENLSGRFSYQRKCYEYSKTFLTPLLTRLQSVFVDSKIQTAFITDNGPQKYVMVKIEWA